MVLLSYKGKYLCGVFAILFFVIAVLCGSLAGWRAFDVRAEQSFFDGKYVKDFEDRFDKNMIHYPFSRQVWAMLSYVFFKEGKDGVLIGDDGWLFTTEEFDRPKDYEDNIKNNLVYIDQIGQQLFAKNINVLVVALPSKAETNSHLGRYTVPHYRENLQNKFDMLKTPHLIVNGHGEGFFLKTDTHWSPKGAKETARLISRLVSVEQEGFSYTVEEKGVQEHKGDLMRYTVSGLGIKPDKLPVIEGYGASSDLFGTNRIPVTLVGTSYSANKKWGFEHYLKKYLKADVLNMADEGLGPFDVMENYLQSSEYKDNKPELVIWEIPVRYLPVKFESKRHG